MAWWNPIDWVAAIGAPFVDAADDALRCYDNASKQRINDEIERDRLYEKLSREEGARKAARDDPRLRLR